MTALFALTILKLLKSIFDSKVTKIALLYGEARDDAFMQLEWKMAH